MKKFIGILLSVMLFSGLYADSTSAAQVTLRVGNNQPDTYAWNEGLRRLGNLLKERSNNRISLTIYPNATLGSEPEMLESVKEGTLDMVICDPTVGTTFCKELELFALPFLFRDYNHWMKALDGETGAKYAKLIEEKSGLKMLAYWGGSDRNVIAVKAPVKSIADLQGFKLRLAPSKLKTDVWKAVGTLPVTIAFGETYSALASGLCDGMENEMPTILANKFYEPAKYLTLTEHEIIVRPLFISKEVFDSLSAEDQKILLEAVREITPVARKLEKDAGIIARKEMEEKFNVQILTIDKAPIVKATSGIFKDFGNETGLTDLIAEIQNIK